MLMAIDRAKIAASLVSCLVRWRCTALVGRANTTVSLPTGEARASGRRRGEVSHRC
jgi:hypothetical protein